MKDITQDKAAKVANKVKDEVSYTYKFGLYVPARVLSKWIWEFDDSVSKTMEEFTGSKTKIVTTWKIRDISMTSKVRIEGDMLKSFIENIIKVSEEKYRETIVKMHPDINPESITLKFEWEEIKITA